ncbi:MAG: hypothetical protein V4515_04630 [Chloroflexota bacterium]
MSDPCRARIDHAVSDARFRFGARLDVRRAALDAAVAAAGDARDVAEADRERRLGGILLDAVAFERWLTRDAAAAELSCGCTPADHAP